MEKQSLKPPPPPPPPERATVSVAGEEEEEDGDEEEMKMETFFALVRNFKEMRDRRREELRIGCDGDEGAMKKRKKMTMTVQNRSAWIPRFEREDFEEDFPVRGPAEEETPVTMKKKKTKVESGEDCLDLNLAL